MAAIIAKLRILVAKFFNQLVSEEAAYCVPPAVLLGAPPVLEPSLALYRLRRAEEITGSGA